jgi:DNA modification methylase
MFSFVRDTVLDPFGGTFSTALAALKANRNSIINEIDREYFRYGETRLKNEVNKLSGLFAPSERIEIIIDQGHQNVLSKTA